MDKLMTARELVEKYVRRDHDDYVVSVDGHGLQIAIAARIEQLEQAVKAERERVLDQLRPLRILRKMWTMREVIDIIEGEG